MKVKQAYTERTGRRGRVQQERVKIEQRLKRLGEGYLDGLKTRGDYLRERRSLEDQLGALVVPGVDAAHEAGNLPSLWDQANLTERRKLLLTMLDAVYVDTVEEKAIVAIRPKPAFLPLFQVVAGEDRDVALFPSTSVALGFGYPD